MEIERIEKVNLNIDDELALDKVDTIMHDVMRYSEDDELLSIASFIVTNIKRFYEHISKNA